MSFKFSKKSLEKLNHSKLHPELRKLMLEAIQNSPIDFSIIETVRTIEQQKINLAKGVSKTMRSKHIPSVNKSGMCEAVDVVPYPVNWHDINRFLKLANHIKNTAKTLEIEVAYGGDWKSFKDYPHWELKS